MSAGGWQGCSPTHVNNARCVILRALHHHNQYRASVHLLWVCLPLLSIPSTLSPCPPKVGAVSVLLSTVRWMSNVCIAPSYHQPVCFPSILSGPVTT